MAGSSLMSRPRALPRERQGWGPKHLRSRFRSDPQAFGKGDIPSRLDPTLGPDGRAWFNGLKREGADLARSDIPLMLVSAHLHEQLLLLKAGIAVEPGNVRLHSALTGVVKEQARVLTVLGCGPRNRDQERLAFTDPSAQALDDLANSPQFGDAPSGGGVLQ